MYAQFFGLSHEPFSIAPDPRYLFMSERHREALAHLLYGVGSGGGFVLLSGEIGAGKTTVCRCFLEQIPPRCNVAYIFNPKLTVIELLKSICDEFRIPALPASSAPAALQSGAAATVKDYLDPLNEFLLRTHSVGQNNVLIIDEAQNLSADVLEQLRLLTNLETNERKLLQIILIGQPELRSLLARPELEQLAQRVTARYHLDALSDDDTEHYIRHRLAVAGLHGPVPFDSGAVQSIHRLARGVPRRINLICDRALLGAYALGRNTVDRQIIERAAAEVFGDTETPAGRAAAQPKWQRSLVAGGLAVGMLLGASIFAIAAWLVPGRSSQVARPSPPASAPAVQRTPAATSMAAARPASAAASALGPAAPGRGAIATPVAIALTAADLGSGPGSPGHDEKATWRQLAAVWRLPSVGDDPCQSAPLQQAQPVQCYRSTGSNLALIRQLDRPGILTLRDANDEPVFAVLTGLFAHSATLRIGGVPRTVSLNSLATIWRGDFATFWRAPPQYTGGVVAAGSGPLADWLTAQLEHLQPTLANGANTGADGSFRARISAFQLAQGLRPDGLAGPTTFMQLNRAMGVDEPHLLADAPPN